METTALIQELWGKYKQWFKNDKKPIINVAVFFIMFIVVGSIHLSGIIRNDNLHIVEITADIIVLVLFNIIDYFRKSGKQNRIIFIVYNICLAYFVYAFVKNLHWVAILFLMLFCIYLPHYNEKDNKFIKVIKKLVRVLFFLLFLLALVINDMYKNDVVFISNNYKIIVVVIFLYCLLIPVVTSTCFRWYNSFKDAYCEQAIGILFLIFVFYIYVFFTNAFSITNLMNMIGWGCTFVGINSLSNTR